MSPRDPGASSLPLSPGPKRLGAAGAGRGSGRCRPRAALARHGWRVPVPPAGRARGDSPRGDDGAGGARGHWLRGRPSFAIYGHIARAAGRGTAAAASPSPRRAAPPWRLAARAGRAGPHPPSSPFPGRRAPACLRRAAERRGAAMVGAGPGGVLPAVFAHSSPGRGRGDGAVVLPEPVCVWGGVEQARWAPPVGHGGFAPQPRLGAARPLAGRRLRRSGLLVSSSGKNPVGRGGGGVGQEVRDLRRRGASPGVSVWWSLAPCPSVGVGRGWPGGGRRGQPSRVRPAQLPSPGPGALRPPGACDARGDGGCGVGAGLGKKLRFSS